jgi:hypothetical protein
MANRLSLVAPPALPLATREYVRGEEDRYRGVLRLFFNALTSDVNAVIGTEGGRFIESPHGSFYDTLSQTAAANTPTAVRFNTTVVSDTTGFAITNNGVGNPTRITAVYPGVYNLQFSLQLQNTDNSQQEVAIWVRVNGVDIPESAGDVTVPARKSASIYGLLIPAWNLVVSLDAGDYVELVWATSSALVTIPYVPAWTTVTLATPYIRPAVPSAILSVSFVSARPA